MKYKITAKDEVKQHLTVAFLTDKDEVFKTVVMDARALPVEDAMELDEALSAQANAMEAEMTHVAKVFSPDIKLNASLDAKTIEVRVSEQLSKRGEVINK